VLSVPTTYHEPKGLFVLEALAAGVPVVQPAHGAFPEMLESLGGGRLVPPGDADGLAAQLADLLLNPVARTELGSTGRAAVLANRSQKVMAQQAIDVVQKYVGNYA